ncbi:MAG: DUF3343 domain-containing protein [Peptococcaceae bacterium]|jgi:hypothetical protein|nr:DUF3343 domain-containing protein [Peptococcaceae bacterium]MDH7524908.1 DUF3343 domain-containing protein [Peptococcaceae bacterium]
MEYLATFHTHSGALKYCRYLQGKGIAAETMPVPRRFSSNCGIGVKFRLDGDINDFISEDIERLFQIDQPEARQIYSSLE